LNEVRIGGKWERDEFLRACRHEYHVRIWDISYVAIFVILGYLTHTYLLFIAWSIISYPIIVFFIFPLRLWNNSLGIQDEKTTIVSDEGISMVGPTYSIKDDWSTYPRSKETSEFYFLQRSNRQSSFVFRKRSFVTPPDESRFRAMLRTHTVSTLQENEVLDSL
jgi:hypothetical protein